MILVTIFVGLAFAPFALPERQGAVVAKVLIFVVLVASFDPAAGLHRHRELCAHHVLRHRGLRHCRGHHPHGATWSALLVGLLGRGALLVAAFARGGAVLAAGAGHFLRHDHWPWRPRSRRWPRSCRTSPAARRPDLPVCRFLSPSFEPFDDPSWA